MELGAAGVGPIHLFQLRSQLGLLDIALAPVPSKGHGLQGHDGPSSFQERIK